MNKKEFLKGITFLGMTFNKEFEAEQVGVWYEYFKDENIETFKRAIKNLGLINKFLPSISEIKKEIAKLENPLLTLRAEDEWEEVLKAIRKYGYYKQEEAFNSLKEITQNAVRNLGWYRLCSSENIQWEKKEFITIFNSKVDGAREDYLLDYNSENLLKKINKNLLEEVKK